MKIKNKLSLWYLGLFALIIVQTILTIGQIGTGIGDLTAYAQLQHERTQLEITKTQLQAAFAASQALQPGLHQKDEYIALYQPITIVTTLATADRSLSIAQ